MGVEILKCSSIHHIKYSTGLRGVNKGLLKQKEKYPYLKVYKL